MSKKKDHSFTGKILSWNYCVKCGLMTLKNDVTRKAMRAACRNEDE